jgi:hypothetical protein
MLFYCYFSEHILIDTKSVTSALIFADLINSMIRSSPKLKCVRLSLSYYKKKHQKRLTEILAGDKIVKLSQSSITYLLM